MLLWLVSPALAGPADKWQLEPQARDSARITFQQRTLASAATACRLIKLGTGRTVDSNPTAMIVASSVSGTDASVTVAPDTGCGLTGTACMVGGVGGTCSGCRRGNSYECTVQPTDSAGNKPTFNFQLDVRTEEFSL